MHNIKVNDIFAASWGWEQTNWDFFKVVKVSPTMVTVRKLKTQQVEDGSGAMRGSAVPTDEFAGDKSVRRKVVTCLGEPTLRIKDYMFAKPWNGQPKQYTSYA